MLEGIIVVLHQWEQQPSTPSDDLPQLVYQQQLGGISLKDYILVGWRGGLGKGGGIVRGGGGDRKCEREGHDQSSS